MIQEERKNLILQELKDTPVVKLEDLAALLRVSVDTVRRDLKALDNDGLVQYIRGGAKSVRAAEQFYDFKGREIIHIDLKREASLKALEWVKKGDVILLNSGTTITILAGELARSGIPCTVFTNNTAAAAALSPAPSCEVHLMGGLLDRSEQSTWGSQCLREIETLYPDLCFLSVNSLDREAGLTDFRMNEIPLMQAMARNARQCAAVMDSTKLGRLAKQQVFPPGNMPDIIMDDQVSSEQRLSYEEAGIHLL